VIAALAAILLPVLSAARAKAREADCQTRLHHITQALHMYADENGGSGPQSVVWKEQLPAYLRLSSPYGCPDVRGFNPRAWMTPGYLIPGYAYNAFLGGIPLRPNGQRRPLLLSVLPFPATTVVFCEAAYNTIDTVTPDLGETIGEPWVEQGAIRHHGGCNYAFLDGHVKWYRPEQVQSGVGAPPPDGSVPTFRPQ
jgi:prepilin-type processing-associated H-X9-DG protein